jgi:asparagine synthase (glutamine-hydrolysing)
MQGLGSAHDVNVGLPFLDSVTLRSFADASGPRPAPPRDEMLAEVVGDLLPERLLRRRTKASFDHPYWNHYGRDFAESWTGRGLDRELVDPDELRREWRSPQPIAASSTLLQLAWVADSDLGSRGGEDSV